MQLNAVWNPCLLSLQFPLPPNLAMSEILRRPWIFDAVATFLQPPQDQQEASQSLAHFQIKSQLVQITQVHFGIGEAWLTFLQFILNSTGTSHILANLSDKFNYIVAFFSTSAIGHFVA